MKRPLRSPPLVTIAEEDVPLAAMAGAFNLKAGGQKRKARGSKRHSYVPTRKVSGLVAVTIMVVKRAAKAQGVDPLTLMERLNKAGELRALGRWAQTGEFNTEDFVPVIAEILGCTITMGPIRVHSNGDFEIANQQRSWQPATDELLQALDAGAMMSKGGTETMAEMAARVILDWKGKRRR